MSTSGTIPQPISEIEVKRIDWIRLFYLLWRTRRVVAIATTVVTLVALVVALVLPKYYKSTAVILPQTDRGTLSGLSGLSDLASMAGLSINGDVPLAQLYPSIILSEAVLRNVIFTKYETSLVEGPADLIRIFDIDEGDERRDFEEALEQLRKNLDIVADRRTNVASVSIETRDPELSAKIVNTITQELDRFLRTKQTTSASEQRHWIELRLVEVKAQLDSSENNLREFREKNRRVTDSPKLLLEQERLIREVTINSTVYLELNKQLEIAKIEEVKNIPIVTVMDPGRPAGKKSSPKRLLIVVTAALCSFLASCVGAFLYEANHERVKKLIASVVARSEGQRESGRG